MKKMSTLDWIKFWALMLYVGVCIYELVFY